MSGPKSYSYRFTETPEQQRLREERQREQLAMNRAQTRLTALHRDYAELLAALRDVQAREQEERITLHLPAQPTADTTSASALERHNDLLTDVIAEGRRQLAAQIQRLAARDSHRSALGEIAAGLEASPRTAQAVLALLANPANTVLSDTNQLSDRQARLNTLRGELARIGAQDFPAEWMPLVSEFLSTPRSGRADALEIELRLRLNQQRQAAEAQARVRMQAEALLARLPDGNENAGLRTRLIQLAAGTSADEETLREAEATANQFAQAASQQKAADAAGILESALQGLGYDVEPISETLFGEGGTLHFQRSDWGDYYVRMRVDPNGSAINFNLVRAAEDPSTGSAAYRSEDERIENAWCSSSGLPALESVLRQRGIDIARQRGIPPGSLAVPAVPTSQLGSARKRGAHAGRSGNTPLARKN